MIKNIKHKYLTRQGYILDTKIINNELSEIKKELTVTPLVHPDYNVDVESFEVFTQQDNYLIVPKFYGIAKFGKPVKIINMVGKKIKTKFNGTLRSHQQYIADKCLKILKEQSGGIVSLPCGGGKTVLGIYMACQLKYKTLVIVHKSFLQDQWVERITQFTDAKIGIIRQNKIDIEGKDIVIGMLQSISMKDYDLSIFSDFNFIIFDEVHHTASRVFSNVFKKIGAKYTLGLSATPYRSDGLTYVINWFIGDIIYKEKRKKDNKVIIKFFEYESSNKLFAEKKRCIKRKVKPDVQKMLTNMLKINERNSFIVDIICHLIKMKGRKIIVLSKRIKHLQSLKQSVDNILDNMINTEQIETNEYKTAYYIGKMKGEELKESAEADVIFGSYAMAEEGLDIDGLNTLIFATPIKNIIQSLGRIMRKPIKDGDMYPTVIDISDQFSCFSKWGNIRLQYYQKQDYIVNKYIAYNDKVITIKDYLIKNNVIKSNSSPDLNILKEAYICYKYGRDYYELEMDTNDNDNDKDKDINDYMYDSKFENIFYNLDPYEYEYEEVGENMTVVI